MSAGTSSSFRRHHGPTWLVALAVYGGWILLTLGHARVPLPILACLGGTVIAWQGSLQHETIHGHPGRLGSWLLGMPPLSLWLPYAIYRETHTEHHATPHLTDPALDPESELRSFGLGRALDRSQQTVVGRMLLGPVLCIGRFATVEAPRFRDRAGTWTVHLLFVAAIGVWLEHCGLPLWKYLLAFVYPGASLTLLRSLAEHRYDLEPARRTRVIEAGWFFRILFLNNNLHVVHHRAPHVPWFELPPLWRAARAETLWRMPDLVVPGYASIVRTCGVRPAAIEER